MIYILMGVSGCGKTTIGQLLSKETGLPFYDADRFHPESNIDKMRSGQPLSDEDRRPWLEAIVSELPGWHTQGDAILACSALKQSYRNTLETAGVPIQWILLEGPQEVIAKRIKRRAGHFFDANLLKSQFEALEIPGRAWNFNITDEPEHIVRQINQHMNTSKQKADIGLIGLGVMGKNLALNIAGHVGAISVYNRHVQGIEEDVAANFANDNASFNNLIAFDEIAPFVLSLKVPRSILLMVNAGKAVDAVIDQLLPHLDSGDCIVDCGNSHFHDTSRRLTLLAEGDIQYIGMGVSGGEHGARFGPSMMPGGSSEAYARLSPILNAIAARDRNNIPCCTYIGENGSGHFVKMIHNGIEYGEMQLIAECFDLLSASGFNYRQVSDLFEQWGTTSQQSYLLEISTNILRASWDGQPALDQVKDIASHKGTGSWSVHAALDLHVPSESIYSALTARQYSGLFDLREKVGEVYAVGTSTGTSTGTGTGTGTGAIVEPSELFEAYSASRLINHIIGFEIIRSASVQMNWDIDMSELARIWTNGCIIRSALMEDFIGIFQNAREHLLLSSTIKDNLAASLPSLRAVASRAIASGINLPVMTSCLNYMTSMRRTNTGARLIAAQRDYFGAHGFYRTGDTSDALHHFNWHSAEV